MHAAISAIKCLDFLSSLISQFSVVWILYLISLSLGKLLPLKNCLPIWQCPSTYSCHLQDFLFLDYSFTSFRVLFYLNYFKYSKQRFSLSLNHKYIIILNKFKIDKINFEKLKNVLFSHQSNLFCLSHL